MTSKSSKRRKAAVERSDGKPEKKGGRMAWIAFGVLVVIVLLAVGVWYVAVRPASDPIVGTWTDDNHYWAYAYYGNGSALELGYITHKTGDASTYLPVFLEGTWMALGNGHYAISWSGQNSTAYEAVIDEDTMSVLNTSGSGMQKVSVVPNVYLVDFNYVS